MIDIDNFKLTNDRYGHLVGDEIIGFVSSSITNILRYNDIFGRYGGDEFIIITHETQKLDVLINRLLYFFESHDFEGENLKIKVSISVGAFINTNNTNYKRAIQYADKMMYEMKNTSGQKYKVFGHTVKHM